MTKPELTVVGLEHLRDEAIELVRELALPRLASPASGIRVKPPSGDDSPEFDIVTDTDFAIQEALHAPLEALLSGSKMLGEEGFERLPDPTVCPFWILDPLDGTLNFAKGMPGFGLSLALIVDGAPVIGIVADGATGQIFDAVAGQGARVAGKPFQRSDGDTRGAPMCLSSGTIQLISTTNPNALSELMTISSRLRLVGGQAMQLCWTATGALCLNVNREAKIWDDAAGALIVREAGGSYSFLSGGDMFPLKAGDPALSGKSLFSLSGDPEIVERAAGIFRPLIMQ